MLAFYLKKKTSEYLDMNTNYEISYYFDFEASIGGSILKCGSVCSTFEHSK